MSKSIYALGIGVGSKNSKGEWLEVFYPRPLIKPLAAIVASIADIVDYQGGNTSSDLDAPQLAAIAAALKGKDDKLADLLAGLELGGGHAVISMLAEDKGPEDVPAAYLKLHLLSHRLVKPHGTNLDGLFATLPNVAWTSEGAVDLSELTAKQLKARSQGRLLEVSSVDKFPRMANYVVPSGVRIAHTARVRLGAYLGEGTTVMHEGFVNFNAGTEGPGMIEGRISAGVTVAAHSDLGGGCSTMGTLSGGNNVIISIGERCLIGANAGVGIPLGDRCTIEAGLYITAGTIVLLLDEAGKPVSEVKARELAGHPDLLFRRNSKTGAVEALSNRSAIELNQELHKHN